MRRRSVKLAGDARDRSGDATGIQPTMLTLPRSRSAKSALAMALVLLVSAADHPGLARSSRGGLNVTALAVATLDPHTIYLGTASGGLFKSTDSGMSWGRADAGLPRRPVDALDVDPENSN